MKRIANIQSKLQLSKDRNNDYSGFKYMSIEDMLIALKPLLEEEDLMMIMYDEIVEVGERNYVKANIEIHDKESGEIVILRSGYAREALSKKGMDESQITGSASSYARKRAVSGLFLIDGEKDADSNEYQKKIKGKIPSVSTIQAKIKTSGLTDEEVEETLKHYRVKDLKDLTGEQKIELDTALTKRIKNNENNE